MRSRLAKKIRKRPWRYSEGSMRQAWNKVFIFPAPVRISREEWQFLDRAIIEDQQRRLKEAFEAAFIRELGLPVDVFKGAER